MFTRVLAIAFIFICTTIAWMILGATVFSRTYDRAPGLRDKVVANWGGPHEQHPPSACYFTRETETSVEETDGKVRKRQKETTVGHSLPLESSRITADLRLDYRQKGLLWYTTYNVAFAGRYVFRNTSARDETVRFSFPFPAERAIYDDLVFAVDGQPAQVRAHTKSAQASVAVPAGRTSTLEVGYRSQGLDAWRYNFGSGIEQVRDFDLRVRTDFGGFDFPDGTLSPTRKAEHGGGWELAWTYRNLLTGQQIGIAAPQKLQPGPLAGQISYFAPVSLLFFFFVMFILTALRRVELHPMNYFFLAAAFFAFHLLLAYLVDQVQIHLAFVIASAVSVFLVVSYLRLVTGLRFAAVQAGSAQIVYLVLFSYAFFLKGFTGLAVTIGAIVTLFVAMQLTGRIRWGQRAATAPAPQGT